MAVGPGQTWFQSIKKAGCRAIRTKLPVGDTMRISRHNLVAGSLAFILLAGLSSVLYDDSNHLGLLLKERLLEKETLFDELRKMKNSPVEKMVMDYSYWDELANYVASPKEKWALDNLDSSFATYNYQNLWIYRNDGVLIRSVQKEPAGVRPGLPFPMPVNLVESIIERNFNAGPFCINTPRGVIEIYAAHIHSTRVSTHEGKSHGLLLAGVLLDEKYLGELSRSSRSTVRLQNPAVTPAEAATDPGLGVIAFSRDLPGLDGALLKTLSVRMEAPDIQQFVRQKDKNALVGTGLISVLYLLAGFVLMSRQRLKIANQNLDTAQQAARMGSWQRSIETGIGSWSDNLYVIFGLPKEGTKPSLESFYPLVHPDDLHRVRAVIEQAGLAKEGHEVEFRLVRPDGDVRTMRSKGNVVMVDGVRTRIVGYTQDITELDRITKELVALNSQKDGLITMLDHDLRTPLTPLTILLPMIRKRVGSTELIRLVDICSKSTASMKKLADKARLLVSLFASVKMGEFERINLISVIEQSLAESADTLAQRKVGCQIDVDPSIAVQVVPGQLKELFANLISNAVRFSSENGNIRISAEQQNGTVTVAVHDDGVGLDPGHLERIFDEFFKADESRHDIDAPGLGLAICRRIIRNHQGWIWAESPGLGKGTTIKFTIK